MKKASAVNVLPFSWDVDTWPKDVYPFDAKKARHLLRINRDKLLIAGAIIRPPLSRGVVVLGEGYARWLASTAGRVTEVNVAANRPEHAPKRFGRGG